MDHRVDALHERERVGVIGEVRDADAGGVVLVRMAALEHEVVVVAEPTGEQRADAAGGPGDEDLSPSHCPILPAAPRHDAGIVASLR